MAKMSTHIMDVRETGHHQPVVSATLSEESFGMDGLTTRPDQERREVSERFLDRSDNDHANRDHRTRVVGHEDFVTVDAAIGSAPAQSPDGASNSRPE
jgi:hypothetical protein